MSRIMYYHGYYNYKRVLTRFKALTECTKEVVYGNISEIDNKLYMFDDSGVGVAIIEETISRPSNIMAYNEGVFEWDLIKKRFGSHKRDERRNGHGEMFYTVQHKDGVFHVYHLKGFTRRWGRLRDFLDRYPYSLVTGSLIENYRNKN